MMWHVLLALLLWASPVLGAWQFSGAAQRVDTANSALFNLPDGDWTLAGWVKIDSNAGTTSGTILSTVGATGSVNPRWRLACRHVSNGVNPGLLDLTVHDSDTTDLFLNSTSTICNTTGAWFHVLIERSGDTIGIFTNGSADGSAVSATTDALTFATETWHVGALSNGSTLLAGATCDWTKWDRALTAGEKTQLVKGFAASTIAGADWYLPMIREYQEVNGGIVITNVNSTTSVCPRLYYPF